MSHPGRPPEFFLDRSLGRIQVPRLLREAGLDLITLAEHYGVPADEDVEDVTWLRDVGRAGWIALMKDSRIRRNPAERRALLDNGVQAFCLSSQSLGAAEMARRFVDRLPAIRRACARPGPFLYTVHANRIEQIELD